MKLGSPIVLTATVNLNSNSAPLLFDSAALQAPNREAVLVSEIRFFGRYPDGFVLGAGALRNLGPEARFNLRLGRYMITQDYVPMWVFAPSKDAIAENFYGETGEGVISSFRWKLRRPMFIPPGAAFSASALRAVSGDANNAFDGQVTPISITLVGRVVTGDFPNTTSVPWVSAYAPNTVSLLATNGDFMSQQGHLENELSNAVDILRINGRICYGASGQHQDYTTLPAALRYSHKCSLQHGNHHIVPQDTEFNVAFDAASRSIDMNGLMLQSGDRVLFKMRTPAAIAGDTARVAPHLALEAVRREAV
ncbi:MAG: hypothetical protein WC729_29325 [Sphingomonas sp.]|jgi:hypothetical protein|uniref:hypothetical protein n=1 Tax=Sphingomonas sp. TaxID=28214 RepID=UPI00356A63A7